MAKKKKRGLAGLKEDLEQGTFKNAYAENLAKETYKKLSNEKNNSKTSNSNVNTNAKKNDNLAPIKHNINTNTKPNADGFIDTGKKLGQYSNVDYKNRKDWKVYSKDDKFYFYNEKTKKYERITNNTNNEMKSADSLKKGNETKSTKDNSIAPKLNTNNQANGKFVPTKGSSTPYNKNKQNIKDSLNIENQIRLDTSGLSGKDYKEYAKALKAKEEVEQKEKEQKYSQDGNPIENAVSNLKNSAGDTMTTTAYLLNKGLTKGVEGVLDFGAILGANISDKLGFEETAENLEEFAKENRTENVTSPSMAQEIKLSSAEKNTFVKRDNIAGGVVENIGQMIPTLLVGGALGKTASYMTTGAGAFGIGGEQALSEGANIDEATLYGAANSATEIATEWLTGGIPGVKGTAGGGLDKLVAKGLGEENINQISKSLTKSLIKAGYRMVGEGAEEGLAEIINPLLKNLTYSENETINWENVIESTIVGGISGGILNAPATVSDIRGSIDYQNGNNLTSNEKNVLNNVIQTRYEQALNENENLSDKEKSALMKNIETTARNDLENGNLTIQDIQNALGNDDYQTYQQETQRKQVLEQQLKELQSKSAGDMSYSEYNENNQKIADLQNEINSIDLDTLKQNVDTPIENRIQNNDYLLQRSYNNYKNNQTQKEVAFKYEPQIDKQGEISDLERNVYDSASKVMNNTKESHSLANFVAKVSKDTGVTYQFTNTQELENNGYKIKGKTINGLNTEDGKILINIDSDSALNRVVGHETTHLFENTEDYKTLQKEVFEYAKMKGDYDKLRSEIADTYKNVKNANIDNELTSELTANYLFSDEKFIQNLSKHRNIFQKIYDKVKHIYNMATAGSKEARQLEKVKRTFEKVYQSSAEASNKATFSIQTDKNGNKYVKIDTDQDIFKGKKVHEQVKIAKQYILNTFRENGLVKDGEQVNVTSKTANEYTHPKNQLPKPTKISKMKASTELDNLLEISTYEYSASDDGRHPFAKDGWDYYRTKFVVDDKSFEGLINIAKSGNKKTLYDITNIKRISQNRSASANAFSTSLANSSVNNVSQFNKNVKSNTSTKYSMSNSENNTMNSNTNSFSLQHYKQKQLDIIQNNNPVNDDYHTWIRNTDDIKTFEEALQDDDWEGYDEFTPDYTRNMANEAVDSGKIIVYSSYPIEQGIFVTPSKMEAESYSGNGKVYSKTVNLQDVAWIDPTQGQYAKVENANYSLSDNNSDLIVPLKRGEFLSKDVKLDKPIAPIKKTSNANVKTNKVVKTQNKSNTKASKVNLPTKKISEAEFKKDIKANAKKMSNTINSIIDSNTMTVKSDLPDLNIRSWVETAIESDVVDNKILLDDINMLKATYEVKSNKKSLEKANSQINLKGYDRALQDFNSLLTNEKANISVENIVMGERLVQEAMKNNDYKTAQELIENIAILGTELGQKVQALSVIQRLTPEGQLRMLTKTVQRAKIKGDKAFDNVQISPEMTEKVLSTYNQDGTWDQDKLTEAVEEVKGEIAEQMITTTGEKANAWRYLSMLGNPKTHIRNLVSNVAMKATRKYKNVIARSIETGVRKYQRSKGKTVTVNSRTFAKPSEFITKYSEDLTMSLRDVIQESNKYDEATELNRMKTIFEKGKVTKTTEKILSKIKNDKVEFEHGVLEKIYRFNSDMLQKEDWWFSSSAFRDTLTEYLTANNIRTQEDLDSNPQIVERAKAVALEESQKATFQQYSWIASKINQMEHKNTATQLVIGGMVPFKKTPINIAKAGLSYSPLGLTKSLTYDLNQVRKGNMEASQAIDNMAQGVAGSSLMLLGYVMAKAGILNGAGDDDKEGKYDSQLGTQSYSIRIGDSTYSLNWLSPVAMPLFIGVNFQNQLEEQQDWDMNVLTGALAQTLDPLTEMSVLQGINQALSSYNSDEAIGGQIGQAGLSALESYLTQFLPTISSQIASTTDDMKRTTTAPANSKFKEGETILNQIKYKIPGLRQTLPVSQDIWGNETKQADNVFQRAFENFLLPASKKKDISDVVDDEIINLYNETGETGIIPSTPPKYLQYEDEKHNFSSKEYTDYRKIYGTTAKEGLRDLFNYQEYINASNDDKVKYIEDVYDYAREKSKVNYFKGQDVSYEASPSYEKTSDYIDSGGTLASYVTVHTTLQNIKSDKDDEGNSINGTASGKKAYYIMNSNLTESQKNWFLADMSDAQPTVEELSLLDDDQNVYNYYFGLNSENKEKFTNFAKAGISQSNYIKFKDTEFKSDKNSEGKTISGSKKRKIINFVNDLPLSVAEKAIYIKSAYKTFDDYNNEIINYINNQDLSIDEKSSILEDLGFKIKGGRVYW